uniref:Myosin X, like 1 n=1 Tax=Echeneis naucrates TaxID=173247 RepID=A0A665TKD2_ECHNA
TVNSCGDGTLVLTTDYGEVLYLQQAEVTRERVYAMHQSSIDGVEDMSALAELHEAAIMHNLYQRYQKDSIYTNIGSILAAVNPYKQISGLYDPERVDRYSKHQLGELPPHIFAVANECYRCIWKRHDSQCVLISGESGAGKTESTKLLLQFLSVMSQKSSGTPQSEKTTRVEQAIVQSSPIMEAFGNAKTVYNNNSSRFGKFIQLHFSEGGNIQGGCIIDLRQNPGERNYHIFYALLAGANKEHKSLYFLEDPAESFHYLSQSGCLKDRSLNDKEVFNSVMEALKVLEFTEEEIRDMFKLLSGVLQLGNIEFMTAGGAQITTKQGHELLGLDVFQLSEVLTQRSIILRGEEICSPLTIEQAVDSRDSVAMALYSQCFSWIILKINQKIKGKENFKSIGILDIFGFENFKVNRFEQFNINYANEKLQEYFNKHIFSLEQLEYNREGVQWEAIDWMDNAECLDLIEKKLGLLALVNEESRFPKGTDFTLLEKLHSRHSTNPYYVKPRLADHQFGIKHYAGEVSNPYCKFMTLVLYDVRGILEKNRDTFRDDILNMLKDSRLDFIYDLFEKVGSRNNEEKMGTARRKPTVSSQFRDSLHALMATLSVSNPFFIRCIKPNMEKNPNVFDPEVVLNQLRYSGMLETVKIRRAGFPVRRTFKDFFSRYKIILKEKMTTAGDDKKRSTDLLVKYDKTKKEWQLGKTKVFLKESLEQRLEKDRDEVRRQAAMIIRAHLLTFSAKKYFKCVRASVVTLQKHFRKYIQCRRYVKRRKAALVLQKHMRGQVARARVRKLREEKKKREDEQRKTDETEKKTSAEGEQEEGAVKKTKSSEARDEARQMEEILQLEREIERLQKKREDEVSQLCESSKQELQLRRDAELKRMKKEASRKATELIDLLNFGGVDPSLGAMGVKPAAEVKAPKRQSANRVASKEEEVDEGFHAEEECIPLPDFPPPAETDAPMDQDMFAQLPPPPPAFAEGTVPPAPPPPPPLPTDGSLVDGEEPIYSMPADTESDYDQEEEEGSVNAGDDSSVSGSNRGSTAVTDEEHPRKSTCTNASIESYRGSSDSYADSDDEHDGMMDTDEEVTNGRVTLLNGNGPPYFHGYLYMKAGLMIPWRRRWCVLKDETFMWFRSKQESLKSGWLYKKGGGLSTLSRRNWKMRWFVLRDSKLITHTHIIMDNHEKENALNIVTDERTYQVFAESPEDASGWFNVLSKVRVCTPEQLLEMSHEQANPKNAVGTLDVGLIDSVCASDNPDRPNSFVIITANRVIHCNSDTPEEMHHWISLLQKPKGDARIDGQEFLVRGWLQKEMKTNAKSTSLKLKKRWFVLTHNSLDYYKSSERNSSKMGTLVLNSLCSVIQPDERVHRETGEDGEKRRKRQNGHVNLGLDIGEEGTTCVIIRIKISSRYPGTEIERYAAFIGESLKKTKTREFVPSQEEIAALLVRQEMSTTVYCHGGGSCKISINSHTTAGEVVEKLIRGLAMEDSKNLFSLFEHNTFTDRALESRVIVADVLAKFERFAVNGEWKLYFKLYCFLDVESMPKEGVEFAFMFEQAHESLISGHFPASEETLQHLAALRLQYLHGDGAGRAGWSLGSVYPIGRLRNRILHSTKPGPGTEKRKTPSFLDGTLRRSFKTGSLKKQKVEEEQMLEMWVKEETSATRTSVLEKWTRLQGMPQHQAMLKYMSIIKEWPGYGSTLFDVECKEGGFPHDLWLSVSADNVSVYKRGEPKPLETFQYEHITFFGASQPCTYKIIVDEREMFFETPLVGEITKIMRAYINMMVKKRCSIMSVTSVASSLVR